MNEYFFKGSTQYLNPLNDSQLDKKNVEINDYYNKLQSLLNSIVHNNIQIDQTNIKYFAEIIVELDYKYNLLSNELYIDLNYEKYGKTAKLIELHSSIEKLLELIKNINLKIHMLIRKSQQEGILSTFSINKEKMMEIANHSFTPEFGGKKRRKRKSFNKRKCFNKRKSFKKRYLYDI
jgi:hypothetical protein